MLLKTKRRTVALLSAIVIAASGAVVGTALPASAQQTGATATKDCPAAPVGNPYTIGSTVHCTATFTNDAGFDGTVTSLTEQAPFITTGNPGNGTPTQITCTTAGGTIGQGSVLAPATLCSAAFDVVIPNDPALCNTTFRDRVEIDLSYPQFDPPLEAGAFATHTVAVVCKPSITVAKTADTLSKITDPVAYTITVCNTGVISVTKTSVDDPLIPGVNAAFGASLAAGACESHAFSRTVVVSDPDPLVNTVTANYAAGIQTATAQTSASTNLFQPGVAVTKNCVPSINEVGGVSTCTIVVTNMSSGDSPSLVNGTINDTLSGNLLAANTNVVSSDCTSVLPTGGHCTIVTARAILNTDPNPVVNTVSVHYNPEGFPNNIDASASASVIVVAPAITVNITATGLSKATDDVTYNITVCNTGNETVTRNSVISALLGDETANFPASLTQNQCATVTVVRTVLASDPDPLVVAVTADYSGLIAQATASSTASTNLFQPSVDVTKSCGPNPVTVGQPELCTIVVTNTSSADTPALISGTISDTLTGDLLAAGNTAIVDSNCSAALTTPCTIHTTRTVLATDPNPLVNTVTVNYHPTGFPNNISDTATASVAVQTPGGQGCTPGFWKQSQHFDSWVGFSPTDKFSAVFGVTITVRSGGANAANITDPTLLQALQANGGGVNALARFAVNALLNSTATQSDFTTAQVIAIVQSGVNPGGLTIDEATQQLSSAPGVVNDNCPLS